MKRRTFIRNATLTGMGVGFVGLNACNSPSKPAEETSDPSTNELFFKLSLAQWSIHRMIKEEGLNPYEFAAKAKAWGFEGLEYVSQLYDNELSKASSVQVGLQKMVKELKMRSDDHGLQNLIMMVDLAPEDGDMAIADEALRSKAITNHYPYVEATAALGCHSMRINMFGSFDPQEWKAASIDALGRLSEYAAKSNVNVLIENHGWLTSNAPLLMEVINEVDMPNCGTLPDFGNFCTKRKNGERWGTCEEEYDKYQGMAELMPKAMAVSAKSYDFDDAGNETTIDYPRMLNIVKEAGYTGYIGVEYEGDQMDEEAGILATRDLLLAIGSKMQTS